MAHARDLSLSRAGLTLLILLLLRPDVPSARTSTALEDEIRNLTRRIEYDRARVAWWKPRLSPGYRPAWIFVPLTKPYQDVPRTFRTDEDLARAGIKHWVKGKSGLYYVPVKRDPYRQWFRRAFARTPQWHDSHWKELERNSDDLKAELRARMRRVEAEIAAMEARLRLLRAQQASNVPQVIPSPAQTVTTTEKEALRQRVFTRVREGRWSFIPIDWQGRVVYAIESAKYRSELEIAEAYLDDVSGCFQARNAALEGPDVTAARAALARGGGADDISRAREHLGALTRQIDMDCAACLEAARRRHDQARGWVP